MSFNGDKSYERYKQYRLNKYRYEQEQIIFPISVIAILAAIISLWKYILITITAVGVIVIIALIIYRYLKKQVVAKQPIVLTEEDAREGVTANITVKYNSSVAKLELDVPPDVKDGQKFVIKNILFKDDTGKVRKKKLYLTVQIRNGGNV